MAEIVLLCGKTGSNKTAYANLLKEKRKAVILSCDDLMFMLYDDRYSMKHTPILRKSKVYLVHIAEQLIAAETNVILDLDLWSAHERRLITQYFKEKGITTRLHYVKTVEQEWDDSCGIELSGHSTYFVESIVKNLFTEDFEEPTEDEVDVLYVRDSFQKNKTD